MKKILLATLIAMTGLMAPMACNAGTAESQATAQAAAGSKVTVLKDDNAYRPGKKVKRLTILDFNATWCGPCKQFSPIFQAAAKKYGSKVDFVSIDTDLNPATANAYGITAIPTVIFITPSGKTTTYVGTADIMPQSTFNALIDKALK